MVIGQSNTHAGIGFDVELDKPVKGIKQLGRFGTDNMKIIEVAELKEEDMPMVKLS